MLVNSNDGISVLLESCNFTMFVSISILGAVLSKCLCYLNIGNIYSLDNNFISKLRLIIYDENY